MFKTSVRAAAPAGVFLFLASSAACGNDDAVRPFGSKSLGAPEISDGAVFIRGGAGSTGTPVAVIPGTGSATDGTAGRDDRAGGGTIGNGGAFASGGAVGTNVAPGTGGTPITGTGGAPIPGTGGVPVTGTGGAQIPGTGGVLLVGTGGAQIPGTGGALVTNTGGAPGQGGGGGRGTGGAPGTGGASGITPTCGQYIAGYDAELAAAHDCKDNKANSCASLLPQRLAGCGSACYTYVDKPNKLLQIWEQWIMDGCTAPACPLDACRNPASKECSADTGLCTDGFL